MSTTTTEPRTVDVSKIADNYDWTEDVVGKLSMHRAALVPCPLMSEIEVVEMMGDETVTIGAVDGADGPALTLARYGAEFVYKRDPDGRYVAGLLNDETVIVPVWQPALMTVLDEDEFEREVLAHAILSGPGVAFEVDDEDVPTIVKLIEQIDGGGDLEGDSLTAVVEIADKYAIRGVFEGAGTDDDRRECAEYLANRLSALDEDRGTEALAAFATLADLAAAECRDAGRDDRAAGMALLANAMRRESANDGTEGREAS